MYPVLPIGEKEYDSGNPGEQPHLDQKQGGGNVGLSGRVVRLK
jgi:hypothetical protein